MPSFGGNLLTQRHQITSVETRNSGLSSGENPESLSDLGLIRYRVVVPVQTDGQTDRIPIANTRSQQYLTVQLSRVKKARKFNPVHETKTMFNRTETSPLTNVYDMSAS